MLELGLDVDNDSSLVDTPMRVAKMYVNEICSGLQTPTPKCTIFSSPGENCVTVGKIPFSSLCEHHFQPFMGTVAIAYKKDDYIVGLSKLNRIVEHCASKP